MLIKKLSRILAISVIAFLAVLLWNTKSSQADESSKLLNSAAIQKIVKKGTLNVGVKQDVPNFGYYSAKTNTYQGMEIDLAKKIAKELKVKVNFTAVTPQTREADERKASYAMSTPYYYDQIGFLVQTKSGYKKLSDLNGKTIGVSQGSSAKAAVEEYASANNLKFDYVQLGSYPELAVSLYAYRIDAFAGDKSILSGYESDKTKILDEGFKTQEYGIASSKSNQELIDYTNDLIAKWQKDGSLQKLYDKYHLKPAKAEDK